MKKATTKPKPKRKHGGGRKAGPPSTGISSYIDNELLKVAKEYTTVNKISRSKLIHEALDNYLTSEAITKDEVTFERWLQHAAPGFDYVISQAQYEMIFAALDEAINMLMLLRSRPRAQTEYAHVYQKKEADVARLLRGFLNFSEEEALNYIRSILDQRKADRDEEVRREREERAALRAQSALLPEPAAPAESMLARITGPLRRLTGRRKSRVAAETE
ncbi:hypothetical protein [Ensifer adhaerens]|uniref:hypothetical protein n=1 Tax=Ensifer adhaerens TaxID=106592 RepID=UPI000CF108FA|nr:hypothetical protein [Ensifer adhaerens]